MDKCSPGLEKMICGDCSARDPVWVSISRILLLCNDCAYIHRTLGPSCSRVKHMRDHNLHPKLRELIFKLGGVANNVWEYTLMNPSKASQIKKPTPTDSLENVKRKFIYMKHVQLKFVSKCESDSFEVRNQELHSTVRTGAVETTLRLLAAGADANFFHPEKRTRPLHVAAKNGQDLQVELLCVFGARTRATDYLGQTAVEHALFPGYKELAHRLLLIRYEVIDKFSIAAFGEAPDRRNGNGKSNFNPSAHFSKLKYGEPEVENIRKIEHDAFEEFCEDLYDELERRVSEKCLLDGSIKDGTKYSIPFLPVNKECLPIRNQARQKLARLTDNELKQLVGLVVSEAYFRSDNYDSIFDMQIDDTAPKKGIAVEDDDYPLYDSVPSEDETSNAHIMMESRNSPSARVPELPPIQEVGPRTQNSDCTTNTATAVAKISEPDLSAKLAEHELKIKELENQSELLKCQLASLAQLVEMRFGERASHNEGVSSTNKADQMANGYCNNNNEPCTTHSSLGIKNHRPSSLCESKSKFRKIDEQSLPARPNTTEVCGRRDHMNEMDDSINKLIQELVELIKKMIEEARNENCVEIQKIAKTIHEIAENTATSLLRLDGLPPLLEEDMNSFLFQVMRSKMKLMVLTDPVAKLKYLGLDTNHQFSLYQQVRRISHDLVAKMKILTSDLRNFNS